MRIFIEMIPDLIMVQLTIFQLYDGAKARDIP